MENEKHPIAAKKQMQEFLEQHGLVVRLCDGAITFCDGNCEKCVEEDEEDYEDD